MKDRPCARSGASVKPNNIHWVCRVNTRGDKREETLEKDKTHKYADLAKTEAKGGREQGGRGIRRCSTEEQCMRVVGSRAADTTSLRPFEAISSRRKTPSLEPNLWAAGDREVASEIFSSQHEREWSVIV